MMSLKRLHNKIIIYNMPLQMNIFHRIPLYVWIIYDISIVLFILLIYISTIYFYFQIKFLTKIYHPNVDMHTGSLGLNKTLHVVRRRSSIESIISNLLQLMINPDDNYIENVAVGEQFKQYSCIFRQTARFWSHIYAEGPIASSDFVRKLNQLMKLGVQKDRAMVVLSRANWTPRNIVILFRFSFTIQI